LTAWREETADEPTPVGSCVEFLYESLAQRRRDEQFGEGVILNTVHGAKGTEYPHVLVCGDWSGSRNGTLEEERRVLYVALTRARESLSVFNRMDRRNPFLADLAGACFAHRRETLAEVSGIPVDRDYSLLGLDDLFLDYAGQCPSAHLVHSALLKLQCGDLLHVESQDNRIFLITEQGTPVARLSSAAYQKWISRVNAIEQVRVVCLLTRLAMDCKDPIYQPRLKVPDWQIPICEFVIGKVTA